MISLPEYVGPHASSDDWTPERQANAAGLLEDVNPLLDEAEAAGVLLHINPQTRTLVAGVSYGGFRPQICPQGAPHSAHKEGLGVDVYDPHDDLDRWLTDAILEKHALYREHPTETPHWVHLTSRRPPSGRRSFFP